jgi:hypothetical protein
MITGALIPAYCKVQTLMKWQSLQSFFFELKNARKEGMGLQAQILSSDPLCGKLQMGMG